VVKQFQQLMDQWPGSLSLKQLGLAFLFVLLGLVGRRLLVTLMNRFVRKVTSRSRTEVDDLIVDAISGPTGWGVVVLGLYMAAETFQPPTYVQDWLDKGLGLIVSLLLTWLMLKLVDVLTGVLHRWAERTDSALDDQLVPLVAKASKVTVGILAALLVLQNMGYSISGVIAGLGVGGLAVALAAQKTLSDLFGSIMLLVDRPFTIGDWVKSPDGSLEGVVEEVGFRSTRIRTFEKTLVHVPNSRLADFIIDNMDRRPIRRVWITVGLTYDTTSGQMSEAVAAIRKVLTEHAEVDQEFFLVRFTDFGPSSLDIMVYYFTKSIVWDEYLATREDVNLKIMVALEQMGLSIAFPTHTVHFAADELPGSPDKT
jgi:MscS family membrane protein